MLHRVAYMHMYRRNALWKTRSPSWSAAKLACRTGALTETADRRRHGCNYSGPGRDERAGHRRWPLNAIRRTPTTRPRDRERWVAPGDEGVRRFTHDIWHSSHQLGCGMAFRSSDSVCNCRAASFHSSPQDTRASLEEIHLRTRQTTSRVRLLRELHTIEQGCRPRHRPVGHRKSRSWRPRTSRSSSTTTLWKKATSPRSVRCGP